MSNVINLKPNADAATALRNIADMIEAGETTSKECTIICGLDVFHVGVFDDGDAAEKAIFNMTVGIHMLMKPLFYEQE